MNGLPEGTVYGVLLNFENEVEMGATMAMMLGEHGRVASYGPLGRFELRFV